MLVYRRPPAITCREGPVDPCVEILEGKEPTDNDPEKPSVTPQTEPTPEVPAKVEDIPLLIGNLVNHMTPPESTTIFKVQDRALLGDITESVNGFSLERGPAEEPALHDFHHLQIAFQSVWQELFDSDVVNKGKELYVDLVELGLDPNEYLRWYFKNTKEITAFLKSLQKAIQDASNGAQSQLSRLSKS